MSTRRHACVLAFCVLLAGCANLNRSIEQRVAISEECRLATAQLPARWDTSAPVASIALGNVGYCNIEHSDTLLALCALKKIKTKYGVGFSSPGVGFDVDLTGFETAVFNLETVLFKLKDAMAGLDGSYQVFLTDFAVASHARRTELAQRSRRDGQEIKHLMHAASVAQVALRREIARLAPILELQAQVELRAWDANLHAQLAQLERLLSGDVGMVLRDGLRDQVLTHVAQRSLDLLHGALKAPTAVINRLDKEAYGAVSVGYLVLGPNIQDAVDQAFVQVRDSYAQRLARDGGDSAPELDLFLAELRRAACNRLLSGTEFSLLSELVDTMLIRQISKKKALPGIGAKLQEPAQSVKLVHVSYPFQDPAALSFVAPRVSPLAVYASNEWVARQQLLEAAIARKIGAGASTDDPKKAFLDVATVDESAVRRLADSATATAVDDATRQYPALLRSSEGMSGHLAANVNLASANAAVSLASVVLDLNVSINNTNSFASTSTNTNTVTPVFNLAPAAPQLGSLCTSANFTAADAICMRDGDGYVITFTKHFFGSDSCQADELEPALSTVARQLADYGVRHGLQYDVLVEGHASHPAARMALCKQAPRPARAACSYRNKLYSAVSIEGCRAAGADSNLRLSAERARNAAEAIELAGNGVIVVRQIAARGAAVAQPTQDKARQQADQTIVLRLRQQGMALPAR